MKKWPQVFVTMMWQRRWPICFTLCCMSSQIKSFVFYHNPATQIAPNSSKQCGADHRVPFEFLRENFGITEGNIKQSLRSFFNEACYGLIGADTPVSTSTENTENIMEIFDSSITVLVKTIKSSVDDAVLTFTVGTHHQFSSCRACKEMLMFITEIRPKSWRNSRSSP